MDQAKEDLPEPCPLEECCCGPLLPREFTGKMMNDDDVTIDENTRGKEESALN